MATGAEGQKSPRALLSEVENILVGVIGGGLETVLLMPLITLKLVQQGGVPRPRVFSQWYTGAAVQAGQVVPVTAAQVLTNGVLEKYVFGATDYKPIGHSQQICCGFISGALSGLVIAPMDFVIIQQQKLKLASVQTMQECCRLHGPSILWKGLAPTTLRAGITVAGYLGMTPVLSSYLVRAPWIGKDSQLLSSGLASCTAGIATAVLTQPIDTIKTRMQSDLTGKVTPAAAQAMLTALMKVQMSGVANKVLDLFHGLGPRVLRLPLAFFVLSCVRECAIHTKTRALYSANL